MFLVEHTHLVELSAAAERSAGSGKAAGLILPLIFLAVVSAVRVAEAGLVPGCCLGRHRQRPDLGERGGGASLHLHGRRAIHPGGRQEGRPGRRLAFW